MSQLHKNMADLPELCYAVEPSSGDTIIIKRGETGYYNPGYGPQGEAAVQRLNERLDVSKREAAALAFGSMFGWEGTGAHPDAYDDEGKFVRQGVVR